MYSDRVQEGLAALAVAETTRVNALKRLRSAETEIKSSLAIFKQSMDPDKRHDAIINLKARIEALFECIKDKVSLHRCAMHLWYYNCSEPYTDS